MNDDVFYQSFFRVFEEDGAKHVEMLGYCYLAEEDFEQPYRIGSYDSFRAKLGKDKEAFAKSFDEAFRSRGEKAVPADEAAYKQWLAKMGEFSEMEFGDVTFDTPCGVYVER